MNKYDYEYVIQGLYEGAWNDLTFHGTRKAARAEKKVYDVNEPFVPHRIIFRRSLKVVS